MNLKSGYVYILGNNKPVLYIGVTSNLDKRLAEHKRGIYKGFTRKYKLTKLLYYEEYPDINSAITREKQLKRWHRQWKMNLISTVNPEFKDLSNKNIDAETSSA